MNGIPAVQLFIEPPNTDPPVPSAAGQAPAAPGQAADGVAVGGQGRTKGGRVDAVA